ncbi:MAG TPA: tetratricopeptide repeat protein, partial [Steroidobacteraceae bacterium]|nr:tetratricopeptide repeat protein [Steroidobacteraceae bacterium]
MTKRDATWWQRLLLPLCAVLFLTAAAEDETRRKTLSVAVFEELQAAQERLDAGDTAGAVRRLEQLATRVADDGFSFGVVQQYAVNAYLQAEQPERARAIAEQALARTDLSADARQQLTYLAGRLALVADDFPVAIERLETWLAAETRPVGEVFYLLGYACYRMERFADAEGHLRNAVALGPATDGWYELLLAVLLEQKKHDAAAELLVERIGADPARAEQWKRLSSLYFTTGQDTEGLAVLRLARGLGLIEDDAELERLLRMHRHVGVPERAARLLSGWLADGGLQPNPERLMTLAELWLEARERDAAKT